MVKRISLIERVSLGTSALKVDRDKCIIYGVKVLGYVSKNGRRYDKNAVREAMHFYEGALVNVDHPQQADQSRLADDRLGRLSGVEQREDGLYANLEYLKSHPLAERLCEAAERMPNVFGFSHNAEGDTEIVNGECVVMKITEVRSVDLVGDPATTNGLSESKKQGRTMKTCLKKLLEKFAPKYKAAKRLMEDDAMASPIAADVDVDDAASPEDALKSGFRAAINAILDDDTLDATAKTAQIKDLLKTHEKIASKKAPEVDVEEEDKPTPKDDDKPDEKLESLQRKFADLEKKDKVRELCEAHNITPDKVLLEALTSAKDHAAMLRLVEREKARGGSPRSSGFSGSSGDTGTAAKDTKSFVEAIKRKR